MKKILLMLLLIIFSLELCYAKNDLEVNLKNQEYLVRDSYDGSGKLTGKELTDRLFTKLIVKSDQVLESSKQVVIEVKNDGIEDIKLGDVYLSINSVAADKIFPYNWINDYPLKPKESCKFTFEFKDGGLGGDGFKPGDEFKDKVVVIEYKTPFDHHARVHFTKLSITVRKKDPTDVFNGYKLNKMAA